MIITILRGSVREENSGHSTWAFDCGICEHGRTKPWLWANGVGHMWRTSGDSRPCWEGTGHRATHGVLTILDVSSEHQLNRFSGIGGWNDPDMLMACSPPI